MTSKCDVMAWNDMSTNPAHTSKLLISLFFFQIVPFMVTKILIRSQAEPWRHDIFMTSYHNVIISILPKTFFGSRKHRVTGFLFLTLTEKFLFFSLRISMRLFQLPKLRSPWGLGQEPHWESRTTSRTSLRIKNLIKNLIKNQILGKTSLRLSLSFSMTMRFFSQWETQWESQCKILKTDFRQT